MERMYSTSSKAKRLAHELKLPATMLMTIGKLMAFEHELIGLEDIKSFVRGKILDDTIGRLRLQDKPSERHIIISGNSGSGKTTSADFIARWRSVVKQSGTTTNASEFGSFNFGGMSVGSMDSSMGFSMGSSSTASVASVPAWAQVGKTVQLVTMDSSTQGGPLKKKGERDKVAKLHPSQANHFSMSKEPDFWYKISNFKKVDPHGDTSIKVHDLKQMETKMEEHEDEKGLTFYLRLPERSKDMDAKYLDALDDLVKEAEKKQQGWIIIFGGKSASCVKLNHLHCFKKQAPWKLTLKTLEHPVLAEIALQEIKHRGYMLTVGGDINADQRSRKKMMMQIMREKLTKEQIEERNVYLAKDCVDKAISSLNLRVK